VVRYPRRHRQIREGERGLVEAFDLPETPRIDGEPITVDFFGERVTFRYAGHVTPAGNRRLSPEDQDRIGRLADRIAELRRRARSDEGLASPVDLGAKSWGETYSTEWHPFFDPAKRRFEYLRLYCPPFTGFDALTNQIHGNPPEGIPEDVDRRLLGLASISPQMVDFVLDQRQLPEQMRVQLPLVFGESGAILDGTIASYDSWSLQKQLNGLQGSGVLRHLAEAASRRGQATIADIGSGFGGLVYQLVRAMAPARVRVVAIDLPESLVFAAAYLNALWADRPTYLATPEGYLSTTSWRPVTTLPEDFAAVFVVNYLASKVLRELAPLDLILNFRSMQEMSDAQVGHYGRIAR